MEKEHNPFANINFNEPLRPEERLPVQQHRITTSAAPANKLPAEGKKVTPIQSVTYNYFYLISSIIYYISHHYEFVTYILLIEENRYQEISSW